MIFFENTSPDYKVVTAKHPIRLLASRVYNKRKSLGIKGDDFDSVRSFVDKDYAGFLEYVKDELLFLNEAYAEIFKFSGSHALVKVDEIGLDRVQQKKLCDHLDLSVDDVSFDNFTDYEIHSIGGNRAPYISCASRKASIRIRTGGFSQMKYSTV